MLRRLHVWGRKMERIGVLGLGRMGREIALRLKSRGADVTGWSRSGMPDGLAIAAADSPAAVVQAADILILSLFDDAAVEAVLDQLFAAPVDGRLIIDTSTVSPVLLKGRLDQARALGASLADAPIAGGPEMVANGSCGIFLGGAEADVARARPVLELISDRVIATGGLGTGMGLKVVNNATIAGIIATLDETMRIARAAGLDFELALRAVAGGPAGPPFLAARVERALGRDDSVGFAVSGVAKDLAVFRGAAADLGVEAPVLDRMHVLADMAQAAGLGERDAAVMLKAAWDRV